MADGADSGTAGSVRALAAALGLGKSRVGELTLEAWWPAKGPSGWNVAACRAAYEQHVRGRVGADAPIAGGAGGAPVPPPAAPSVPSAPAAPAAPARRELDERGRGLVEQLKGDSDALVKLEAAVQLLAQRLGEGVVEGGVPARVAGDVANLARELRQARADDVKRQRERGELIERTVARAVAGELGRRLVQVLARVEGQLGARVEMWIGDDAFRAMSTEERAVAVRAWFGREARTAREVEAAEIERLIAAEAAKGATG
jgi:hypothetical protein